METSGDPLALVGTTIAEKYAVESVVGEGGFAIVYRAMHTVWKRPVAVKVFKALGDVKAEDREKLLADFIQEGALLADPSSSARARSVRHATSACSRPAPARTSRTWSSSGLEGAALEAVLAALEIARRGARASLDRGDGAPPRSDRRGARARAQEGHRASRREAGQRVRARRSARPTRSVKLLDFGIAKVVQDAQKMGFGKTAGHITSFTPLYGAPEQFDRAHGSTGPWTDVFALALTATELLTGRDPLDGDTLMQLAFAASDPNSAADAARRSGSPIPDAVEAVFQKALAVKPEERFQTAGDFWNALRMVVLGRTAWLDHRSRPRDPTGATSSSRRRLRPPGRRRSQPPDRSAWRRRRRTSTQRRDLARAASAPANAKSQRTPLATIGAGVVGRRRSAIAGAASSLREAQSETHRAAGGCAESSASAAPRRPPPASSASGVRVGGAPPGSAVLPRGDDRDPRRRVLHGLR